MFGNTSRVSRLAVRKQLLIAESELNRAQLAEEWAALRRGVCAFTDRARALGSIVSAGALLVTGLAAHRRGSPTRTAEKPAWWQRLLNAAGMIATVWLAFRPKGREEENHEPPARA